MFRRLTLLLLLTACQAAGPESIVARARSLSVASPELHARLDTARPLDGLQSHGAAVLKSAPQRVLVARLPADAAAPLAASDSGALKRALTLTLQGAASIRPQPSGDWLVYGGALADTDLAMFADDTLVEALFVLRSPAAPRQLDYRLALSDGLRARSTALGIELVDPGGDVALRIPPSRAFDARGAEVPVRQWLEHDVLHLALQREPAAWPVLWDPIVEVAVWQQPNGGDPLPVGEAAAAYDSVRDRVVLYGGSPPTGVATGETWEWDGAAWQLMSTSGATRMIQCAAAYDPVRKVTVLYAGYGGQLPYSVLTETWEWDGSSWTQRSTTPPPGGGANGVAMAWDDSGQRLLMFGGELLGAGFSDATVAWDGTAWSIAADPGPPARHGAALAYDPGRGVVVLFGGAGLSGDLADTWELSGSTWTQKFPSAPLPPARNGHGMAYSASRGAVVLFAGNSGGVAVNDVWEWKGTAWSQLPDAPFLPRHEHNTLYDSLRQRNLVLMGFNALDPLGDLWAWNGATWQDVTPRLNPSRRRAAAMAYDVSRGVTTLFGGNSGPNASPVPLQDTWEWDGTKWSSRAGPQPSAAVSPAMAFDVSRGLQVLSTNAGETWEWDGGAWRQRAATLAAPALAYDGLRKVTVAVVDGGVFEYAGSSWSPRAFSGPSPTNTTQFGLTADGHGQTWLFGGNVAGSSWSSQIWAWDGGTWAQYSAPGSLQRERAAWLWDTTRDLGVLYGGATSPSSPPFEDTQLFITADGGTWKAVSGTHPPGRVNAAFAYDSRRGRGVLFGGGNNRSNPTFFDDTWELSWRRANGSDCSDAGQCVSGLCTDGVCCDVVRCLGRCSACDVNGLGTCAALPLGAAGAPSCAPYVCDGVSKACPSSCSGDAGCAGGSSCIGGMCTASLPKGADCVNDGQCLTGYCAGGVCCLTACDGGCQTCRQSEGASENGVCGARPTSHTCRAAADQCDVAETCDGVSPDCPTDRFAATDVMCRAAVDTCDVAELCTGMGPQCPRNELKPHGATCASSLQTCAAAAQCDGLSPLCPASAPALASTPCRPLAGPCDRAEVCDGVHLDCPTDELLPAGSSCGEEQECAARCNGTSVECQPCAPVSRFAFGCAAAPAPALLWGLVFVLRRRRNGGG